MLIGLIVNPIAGMGGRVGLKGTDGIETLKEAIELGAKPKSGDRAFQALKLLTNLNIKWVTWSGSMGEDSLRLLRFCYKVVGKAKEPTIANDTKKAAQKFKELNVDLIVFVGGDGTASDIVEVVNMRTPILGIPAGVKMYSGVFTSTPSAAGRLIDLFVKSLVPIVEREIMDIDENAYRLGILSAKLKGYCKTPFQASLLLSEKSVTSLFEEDIMKKATAEGIIDIMNPEDTYILGPGTTVREISNLLSIEKTLLGVDIIRNGELVARDVNEEEILDQMKGDSWIIVSPLGGQGSIFGRGNQQISPRVIKKAGINHIIIVSTPIKLQELNSLVVDTGDHLVDVQLRGWRRVFVGRHEQKLMLVR